MKSDVSQSQGLSLPLFCLPCAREALDIASLAKSLTFPGI